MLGRGHIEERFVERDRLDERRSLGEEGHDGIGRRFVLLAIAGNEDGIRTQPARGLERHR
jgi:hypothetical protein